MKNLKITRIILLQICFYYIKYHPALAVCMIFHFALLYSLFITSIVYRPFRSVKACTLRVFKTCYSSNDAFIITHLNCFSVIKWGKMYLENKKCGSKIPPINEWMNDPVRLGKNTRITWHFFSSFECNAASRHPGLIKKKQQHTYLHTLYSYLIIFNYLTVNWWWAESLLRKIFCLCQEVH